MNNVGLVILAIVCISIGWVGHGLKNKTSEFKPMMAYGINETTQLWNRVRVNDSGQVICAKEE